jgi:hypothetical protein
VQRRLPFSHRLRPPRRMALRTTTDLLTPAEQQKAAIGRSKGLTRPRSSRLKTEASRSIDLISLRAEATQAVLNLIFPCGSARIREMPRLSQTKLILEQQLLEAHKVSYRMAQPSTTQHETLGKQSSSTRRGKTQMGHLSWLQAWVLQAKRPLFRLQTR